MTVQLWQLSQLKTIILNSHLFRGGRHMLGAVLIFLSALIIMMNCYKMLSLQKMDYKDMYTIKGVHFDKFIEMKISTSFAIALQLLIITFTFRKSVVVVNILLCTTALGTFLALTSALRYGITAHSNQIPDLSNEYPLNYMNQLGTTKIKFVSSKMLNNIFHEMFIINLDPRVGDEDVSYRWLFGFAAVFVGILQTLLINRTLKYFEKQTIFNMDRKLLKF